MNLLILCRDRPIWLCLGRYRYIDHSWADTDISKIFKSCFLVHYQKYDVFYALPFFKTLKIRTYKPEFLKLQQFHYLISLTCEHSIRCLQ